MPLSSKYINSTGLKSEITFWGTDTCIHYSKTPHCTEWTYLSLIPIANSVTDTHPVVITRKNTTQHHKRIRLTGAFPS